MSDVNTVVTWFKDIFSSVFNIFFDLTSDSKIFVFILPTVIILLLILIFDYIIPILFDEHLFTFNHGSTNLDLKDYKFKPLKVYSERLHFIRYRRFLRTSQFKGIDLSFNLDHAIKQFELEYNRKPTNSEISKIKTMIKVNEVKSDNQIDLSQDKTKVNDDEKIIKFPGNRESA